MWQKGFGQKQPNSGEIAQTNGVWAEMAAVMMNDAVIRADGATIDARALIDSWYWNPIFPFIRTYVTDQPWQSINIVYYMYYIILCRWMITISKVLLGKMS